MVWGVLDRLCAPPRDIPTNAEMGRPFRTLDDAIAATRVYPRVTIWKDGIQVKSGELVVLTTYFSKMARIMVRPFRGARWTATFYWSNGAWSSATFDTVGEMNDLLNSTAARVLGWPEPERI